MQDKLKKLMDVVSSSEKVELMMLNNGFVAATKEYQKNSSPKNISSWRKLREDLNSFIDRLSDKYNLGFESDKTFKTQRETIQYLQEQGWKIAKSALSNHVRAGLLKKRDGVFDSAAVDRYAELHLEHLRS